METPHAGLFVRQRLRALGEVVDVRVIHPVPTPFWSTGKSVVYQEAGPPPVRHIRMPYLPGIGAAVGGLNPFLYARSAHALLASWVRDGQVDILDAHFSWPDGVAARRLARSLHLPYSICLRGVLNKYTKHATKRRSIIESLRGASAVIAVSESIKRAAMELGIREETIHVIPNGIDSELFRPGDRDASRVSLGRQKDETLLITVGHLCSRKGFHRVLEIMPELLRRDSTVRYVAIGDDAAEGRFASHLRRLARRLGVYEQVTFTGSLEPQKIAQWLQAADLFVLPTTNEGWCNALCEAVATGLLVVCTDVGGNREIVTPGAGLVISPHDPRALVEAILSTLRPGAFPRAVARVGAQRSWSEVARETATVLEDAVQRGPAKARLTDPTSRAGDASIGALRHWKQKTPFVEGSGRVR